MAKITKIKEKQQKDKILGWKKQQRDLHWSPLMPSSLRGFIQGVVGRGKGKQGPKSVEIGKNH